MALPREGVGGEGAEGDLLGARLNVMRCEGCLLRAIALALARITAVYK